MTLVTCIQLLYLECLRVRTRELPALQFFRETLEPRIKLDTERGALTFSLVKHIGLGLLGCLIVPSPSKAPRCGKRWRGLFS